MIQKTLNAKNIFALLFIVLIITKLHAFEAIKLDSHFIGHPIIINWPLILTVFVIAAGAIFVRRGSNDCWFIALNFVGLILVSIVLEWYQPGLGIGIFMLMLSTAVAEELIVRYAFFELLWPRFKPAMIVLLSALLFMGIHTNIYTQFESSLSVFLFGLVLGAIYAQFKQKDQTIKGIALVSWLHLGALLLDIYL
ncbi:CPBP family intramembrane glutamic endopeptidase [Hydrogenovibrio sp. JE_KL2]|uniref:CPBP family intramembrane glutamic endopeptidase n=1 Tax=Hydrogenovibrio sp. JE_KL2 TaxID=2651188 RepID=UPI001562B2C9|nr:CPBP family intramembrane glutamic endopeptidase [Hydrogenovibrio sp. JE_KL2]